MVSALFSASSRRRQPPICAVLFPTIQLIHSKDRPHDVAVGLRQWFQPSSFSHWSVLVLGRELTGLADGIEQGCDRTLTIPQYGMAECLNIQTAAAIASYEYMRQWGRLAFP